MMLLSLILAFVFINVRTEGADVIGRLKKTSNGYNLVLECDTSNFHSHLVPQTRALSKIGLEVLSRDETSFRTIASYAPFARDVSDRTFSELPEDKNWEVTFQGEARPDNRDLLKVIVTIVNVECIDSALYRCFLLTPGTSQLTYSDPYNFTFRVAISEASIRMTPFNSYNGPFTSKNSIGDSISLNCITNGPKEVQLIWLYKDYGSNDVRVYGEMANVFGFEPLRIAEDQGCEAFVHRSSLRFKLSAKDDKRTFYCAAYDLGIYAKRANFTIYVIIGEFVFKIRPPETFDVWLALYGCQVSGSLMMMIWTMSLMIKHVGIIIKFERRKHEYDRYKRYNKMRADSEKEASQQSE
ncbi:hypothetical protein Btru_032732 [Bulinus truncatus]|nr:hypothetical protein Btru_032732 [Bulinus truncatus]